MNDPREEAKRITQRVGKRRGMPSSGRIVSETFARLRYLPATVQPADVLVTFNTMLRRLWERTLTTLESYEEQTHATGIPEEFVKAYPVDVAKGEQVAKGQGFGGWRYPSAWPPGARVAGLTPPSVL